MSRVLPRQPAPELVVPTLSGTTRSLADAKTQRFSLIVFYRGLHCPVCKTHIPELDKQTQDRGHVVGYAHDASPTSFAFRGRTLTAKPG